MYKNLSSGSIADGSIDRFFFFSLTKGVYIGILFRRLAVYVRAYIDTAVWEIYSRIARCSLLKARVRAVLRFLYYIYILGEESVSVV